MAFTGGGGPISEGIYSTKGGLHTVVDTLGNFPGTPNQFRNFQGPSFDGSTVALTGSTLAGDQGLLAGNGSLQVIADKTTPIPGGTGNFLGIGSGLVSNGEFAFIGVGDSNQRGVYRTTPSGLARVADTDHLDSRLDWRVSRFQESEFRRFTGRVRRVGSGTFRSAHRSRRYWRVFRPRGHAPSGGGSQHDGARWYGPDAHVHTDHQRRRRSGLHSRQHGIRGFHHRLV
jgi:hypothetical protein